MTPYVLQTLEGHWYAATAAARLGQQLFGEAGQSSTLHATPQVCGDAVTTPLWLSVLQLDKLQEDKDLRWVCFCIAGCKDITLMTAVRTLCRLASI